MDENLGNSGGQPPNLPPSANLPSGPPKPIPVYLPPGPPASGQRRTSFLTGLLRYFFVLVFVSSVILNIYFYLILFATGGVHERSYQAGHRDQKIALIALDGLIDLNAAYEFREMLQRAEKDDSVKGVILVVNSPGGYVAPSNMMNKYIHDFTSKTEKKLYASIEMLGASGAYWACTAADKVYAQENAAVGSIGVIYVNFVLQGILEEKLGISPVVIKSTRSPFKDRGSRFRMPTELEKAEITKDLDTAHQRFVKVVSANRKLTEEQVWEFASGEVYDGPEALEKELIDAIGFLDDVIDDLAQTLGLEDPTVVRYSTPPSLREMLAAKGLAFKNPFDIQKQLEQWDAAPRIQALWLGR